MRCIYYKNYYIHALIKQRQKRNGSIQSCIFDPSSKYQIRDVPFTHRHMHTSDTDTHIHIHIVTSMNTQNQKQANTLICHIDENIIKYTIIYKFLYVNL